MPMRILSALLMAAWSSSAAAQSFPKCVDPDGAFEPPAGLNDLLECQKRARKTFEKRYRKLHAMDAPASALDRLNDFQSAEVKSYAESHPGRAGAGTNPPADDSTPPSTFNGAATAPGSASDADRLPSDMQGDLADLQKTLNAESDGGKNGITPQMARQITEYLSAKQGGVSPDMRDLLEAVQKDGSNLKPGTMKKLKRAAREAKQSGLDLKVSPDVEKDLLAPDDDAPAAAPPLPPAN